eukprot:2050501-Amphidinium_carterae.1
MAIYLRGGGSRFRRKPESSIALVYQRRLTIADMRVGDAATPTTSSPAFLSSNTEADRAALDKLLNQPLTVSVVNALEPRCATIAIDSELINVCMSTAGSRRAFDTNRYIASRLLHSAGTTDKNKVFKLAIAAMMLAVSGYTHNPLLVGSAVWDAFAETSGFVSKANPTKPLNNSPVVAKISPSIIGEASDLNSAVATPGTG